MLTDSKVVQAIVAAFSWFLNAQYGAFRPDQVDAALAWLHEASPIDVERARRVLQERLEESNQNQSR